MSRQPDLQVDTAWIRRAAASLDDCGRDFSAGHHGSSVVISSSSLGLSTAAIALTGLLNLRCGQAEDAAVQLTSVSVGLSAQLRHAASEFDRYEAAIRLGTP
jgi:hypothetical protein